MDLQIHAISVYHQSLCVCVYVLVEKLNLKYVWKYKGSAAAAAAPKSLQLCPTLCNPIDGSPSGSTIPGILQARTLECVAISFSNA